VGVCDDDDDDDDDDECVVCVCEYHFFSTHPTNKLTNSSFCAIDRSLGGPIRSSRYDVQRAFL